MAQQQQRPLAPLNQQEEDAIIRTRLSVDERPMRRIIKKLATIAAASDDADVEALRQSSLLELDAYELMISKMRNVSRNTARREVEGYVHELSSTESEHAETIAEIAALKTQLKDAQRERANKLEYDALAKEIAKYETRANLEESISRLHGSLDSLRSEATLYNNLASTSRERFGELIGNLASLHADIGSELGERAKQEVERAEGERDGEEDGNAGVQGEGEGDGDAPDAATTAETDGDGDAENRPAKSGGMTRSTSGLNPAAPAFRPGGALQDALTLPSPSTAAASRASSPGSGTGSASASASVSDAPRRSTRKRERPRDMEQSTTMADEEGELEEGEERADPRESRRGSGRSAKGSEGSKKRVKASEEGEMESEEEEGSIRPTRRR